MITTIDYPKPVRRRDGTVTIDRVEVGRIDRVTEPVGPTRRDGTRRHHAFWYVYDTNGDYVTKNWTLALAKATTAAVARRAAREA